MAEDQTLDPKHPGNNKIIIPAERSQEFKKFLLRTTHHVDPLSL